MKYFEFNKHDYYALIKAENEEVAVDIYLEFVAGESIEQIKEEGLPDELSPYEALVAYGQGFTEDGSDVSFKEVFESFTNTDTKLLLIDGSLL